MASYLRESGLKAIVDIGSLYVSPPSEADVKALQTELARKGLNAMQRGVLEAELNRVQQGIATPGINPNAKPDWMDYSPATSTPNTPALSTGDKLNNVMDSFQSDIDERKAMTTPLDRLTASIGSVGFIVIGVVLVGGAMYLSTKGNVMTLIKEATK